MKYSWTKENLEHNNRSNNNRPKYRLKSEVGERAKYSFEMLEDDDDDEVQHDATQRYIHATH